MKALAILWAVLISALLAGAAMAQNPGGPPPGSPCSCFSFDLREGPNEVPGDEHQGPFPTPCPVYAGYVVLYESTAMPPQAQQNWSDVVAFTAGGPVQPGQLTDQVWFISDSPNATGQEVGITDADLAVAGLHVSDITSNPNTFYLQESATGDLNGYQPLGGESGLCYRYNIYSDPAQEPTPTRAGTWGRLKIRYR